MQHTYGTLLAAEVLNDMLSKPELADAALLVWANKQDLPNSQSVAVVTDKLGLHSLRNRQWYIQAACATTGNKSVTAQFLATHALLQEMDCMKDWTG